MASLAHNRPAQYRHRAEELRVKAESMVDDAQRRQLLEVADTWERMANWEETNPIFAGFFGNAPESRQDTD